MPFGPKPDNCSNPGCSSRTCLPVRPSKVESSTDLSAKKASQGALFWIEFTYKGFAIGNSLKLLRQLDKTHLPQLSVISPKILSCSAKTRKIKCKQISNFWVKWTKILSQSWDNLGYKRRQLHPLGNIHFTLQKKQEKCSGKNSHWNSLNLSPRCRSFE